MFQNPLAYILHALLFIGFLHLFPLGHDILNAELAGDLLLHPLGFLHHQTDLAVIFLREKIVVFRRFCIQRCQNARPRTRYAVFFGCYRGLLRRFLLHLLQNLTRIKRCRVLMHDLGADLLQIVRRHHRLPALWRLLRLPDVCLLPNLCDGSLLQLLLHFPVVGQSDRLLQKRRDQGFHNLIVARHLLIFILRRLFFNHRFLYCRLRFHVNCRFHFPDGRRLHRLPYGHDRRRLYVWLLFFVRFLFCCRLFIKHRFCLRFPV